MGRWRTSAFIQALPQPSSSSIASSAFLCPDYSRTTKDCLADYINGCDGNDADDGEVSRPCALHTATISWSAGQSSCALCRLMGLLPAHTIQTQPQLLILQSPVRLPLLGQRTHGGLECVGSRGKRESPYIYARIYIVLDIAGWSIARAAAVASPRVSDQTPSRTRASILVNDYRTHSGAVTDAVASAAPFSINGKHTKGRQKTR